MAATVDTSTSTTAVAFGSQRHVVVTSLGVIWVCHFNGTALEMWYSTNGTSFTQDTGTFTGENADLFIDADDFAHLVIDNSDAVQYYRGTPNVTHTDWTWVGPISAQGATGNSFPSIVAHREGSGWKAHIVWSRNYSSAYGHTEYRCKCVSTFIWLNPEPGVCLQHGHTTYTPWYLTAPNCACGAGCNEWQNGWHSHAASGCSTANHLHQCSYAQTETRYISDGTTTDNYVYYTRYNISDVGAITVDQTAQVIGGSYNTNRATYPVIDFHHTGDTKTVKDSAPHVFVAWSAGTTGASAGIRFRKATYSGGNWNWGTDQPIITTEYANSSYITGIWDGTRFVCDYVPSGSTSSIKHFERDVGDTATIWRTPTALADGVVTGLSVTTEGGTVFLYAVGTTSDDVKMLEYDRAENTWDAVWTTVETTTAVAQNLSTKRGTGSGATGSGHAALYLAGAGSPYDVEYTFTATNSPPNAPLWLTPVDGDAADVAEILTLDWQFQDPQPSDTQSAYSVRKREGAAAYEYWNGSTWDSSESGSTKIVSSDTQLALAAAWGVDGDNDHYYSAKTWDAADAGPSSWSTELQIVPSGQDNPTITTITTITGAFYNVVWTVTTQTKFRLRVYGDATGIDYTNLIYDSGIILSAVAEHLTPFPLDGVTRWVSLYTWNDEGLLSDEDTEDAIISYTGPMVPTLVVAVYQSIHPYTLIFGDAALEITITNPTPTGGEPVVSYNDVYRRVVGDTDDGIRVGAEVATNTEWIDWAVASGVTYEYLARAIATSNGSSTDSIWTP